MTGQPKQHPLPEREAKAKPGRGAGPAMEEAEKLGLKVLLGELEALSHLLPCGDQNTSTQDGADDAFDNMPV